MHAVWDSLRRSFHSSLNFSWWTLKEREDDSECHWSDRIRRILRARGGEEECIDESPSARHGGSYSHSIIVSPAQLAIPVGGGTTATTMMSGVMVLLLLLLLTLLSTRRRARIVACSMRDDINRAWRGDGRPMVRGCSSGEKLPTRPHTHTPTAS